MTNASDQDYPEFEPADNKEYKVEAIRDSAIYAKKADEHLPELYYLVAWKGYPEEEKHLGTFLGYYAPSEDGQHLPQGPSGEVDSNISTPKHRSAQGQANDPAPREAKTKVTNRMR